MDYEWFKEEFYKLTTIQLDYYKEKQMKRRINTLIQKKGMSDYVSFIKLLQTNEKELSSFIDYITINVTKFFRTPDHWKYIESEILSKYNSDKKIRIWSAAASSGEEAYSIAMCLADYVPLSQIEIIATDIDKNILAKAQKGIYDVRSIDTFPEEYLERYLKRYFIKQGQLWIVKNEIKQCIDFRQMDLLKDEYPKECDMIICRNVLIYFTEDAKKKIYAQFLSSLKEDGCLFTGDTEQIVYHKLFGFKKEKNFLYRVLTYGGTNR